MTRPLSRRRLLGGSVAAGALVAAGTGYRHGHARQIDPSALRLLCWQGYDDRDATAGFRKRAGIDIHADYLGANDEIFTRLRAGGIGTFDVVTPADGVVQGLATLGLIQPLDLARLPNAAALLPRFATPAWAQYQQQLYAIPLSWRTAPMVYDAARVPVPPSSWTALLEADYKGKVAMTDDVVSHLLTWNRALGAADPARVTTFALNQTISTLIRIKRDQAAAFVGGGNDLAQELVHGRSRVSTTGRERIPRLGPAKGAKLALAHPSPGDFSTCDCLCIPADAPHLDAAYALIDHLLAAETQAMLAGDLAQGVVATGAVALLDASTRALYAYDDLDSVFAVSPLVGFPPLDAAPTGVATYVDWVVAWDRVRYTPMHAFSTPTPVPTRRPFVTPRAVPSPTPSPTPSVASPEATPVRRLPTPPVS